MLSFGHQTVDKMCFVDFLNLKDVNASQETDVMFGVLHNYIFLKVLMQRSLLAWFVLAWRTLYMPLYTVCKTGAVCN